MRLQSMDQEFPKLLLKMLKNLAILFQNPWAIVILNQDDSVHCSGSLVTKKLILTAGHCFAQDVKIENLRIAISDAIMNSNNPFSTTQNLLKLLAPLYTFMALQGLLTLAQD